MQIPENIEKNIKSHVRSDLSPAPLVAFVKAGVALSAGGGLSLFLCGQFGIGLSNTASAFSHQVHHGVGPLACAAICGGLFALVPVVIMRLICRPLQFRALLRNSWQLQLLWTAAIGSLLSYHGNFGFEFTAVAVWVVTAYSAFRLLGEGLDFGFRHLKQI